jgi:hypothetical protein
MSESGGPMEDKRSGIRGRRSSHLHPFVSKAMIAFAAWLILASWGFFSYRGAVGLMLAVVTVFVVIAVGLPWTLAHIWRRRPRPSDEAPETRPLRDWLGGEFEAWQTRLRARDAMIQLLLPLAAVAIGMMAFAIIDHFVVNGPM